METKGVTGMIYPATLLQLLMHLQLLRLILAILATRVNAAKRPWPCDSRSRCRLDFSVWGVRLWSLGALGLDV